MRRASNGVVCVCVYECLWRYRFRGAQTCASHDLRSTHPLRSSTFTIKSRPPKTTPNLPQPPPLPNTQPRHVPHNSNGQRGADESCSSTPNACGGTPPTVADLSTATYTITTTTT